MNYYFDEDSQKMIVMAKKEMYELKHPYVGTEHLLLAILHSKISITELLNSYGIFYDDFRNELIKDVGIGKKDNQWFLFTPLLKKILHNSIYYSRGSENVITPLCLLLSLLQEGDGVANRILLSMGIDIKSLKDKISSYEDSNSYSFSLLNELGINMNERSIMNQYDPVIGREEEVIQIIQNLLRKNKNNPLLIGEAGVGKTAIVEELSRRIALGNVPFKLKDKVIYSISMSNMVSGTKYRGEFEEKFHKLLDEVMHHPEVILFIDEVHTLMGAGGAEGAIDASNIIKPYLARGDIKIIGATTVKEYNDFIHKDKALDRRFQKIYIQEATKSQVKSILKELRPIYEEFHQVIIEDDILDLLVDYSYSCIFNGRQPDKTIDFLDEVCSYVTLYKSKNSQRLCTFQEKIIHVERLKNYEIQNHNFKEATTYRSKEKKLRKLYHSSLLSNHNNSKTIITKDDICRVVNQKVGCCNYSEWIQKILKCKRHLKQCIIGQDDVLDAVLSTLKKYDYIQNKESLIFLLVGKKGSGKTFFVRKLLDELFLDNNVISLDMSEYTDSHMISKIIGTSPGYVGYQDTYLFQSIQEKPFTILFFDNIDKANPQLMNQLLESFYAGYFFNPSGEKVFLSKCIVFMSISISHKQIGFANDKKCSVMDKYSKIKNIIYLNEINEAMIRAYLKRKVSDLDNNLKKNILRDGLKVNWDEGGFHSICDYLEKEIV